MTYDQKLMDRCIRHALDNPIQSRGRNTMSRMAALITNGSSGDDIFAWNKYKTHPLMLRFSKDHTKIHLHAEISALVVALSHTPYYLPDYDIYIARVLKNGEPALAKPCDTCFGALTYFGIRNIWWTQ